MRSGRGPRSATQAFTDPDRLTAALRSGDGQYRVLGRGAFYAESTVVELGCLTLQCTFESLARVAHHVMQPRKVAVLGWPRSLTLPVIRGTQMRPGDLMSHGRGMESYHRTAGSIDHAALILNADELKRVSVDLLGRELELSSGQVLRPSDHARVALFSLIEDARSVARDTPQVFASAEASRALEQSLLHAIIRCLSDSAPRRGPASNPRRAQIMARFDNVIESCATRPLYVAELCRLIGVPERTLRKCCQEHLGMGPHRYLLLRRMNLARRALLHENPNGATVTSIATRHGFWELGRFAALYRSTFGEMPSATLRRFA